MRVELNLRPLELKSCVLHNEPPHNSTKNSLYEVHILNTDFFQIHYLTEGVCVWGGGNSYITLITVWTSRNLIVLEICGGSVRTTRNICSKGRKFNSTLIR